VVCQRLASDALEIAQVAHVRLPAHVGRQLGRKLRSVVMCIEQLIDEQRQLRSPRGPSARGLVLIVFLLLREAAGVGA